MNLKPWNLIVTNRTTGRDGGSSPDFETKKECYKWLIDNPVDMAVNWIKVINHDTL